MCCVYTEVYSYFGITPRLFFSFHLCLRLTSPNYAFIRRRPYSKRKVKEYGLNILLVTYDITGCVLPFCLFILLYFSLSVKAVPHECVIRTGQP